MVVYWIVNFAFQESMREIEETLNQQLFGNTTELELDEDKEQAVLFDQGFESCVFSAITLQVQCHNII